MNREICGECKWHIADDGRPTPDWYCGNDLSDYFGDYTDYTDTCECFEQRGVEQ